MIYITGDTHGNHDIDKLISFFNKHKNISMNDYLIIVGDFGAIWNEKTLEDDLKFYENLPCNILFIDGNHENFPLLYSFKEENWNGGRIHRIKKNIIHLMRGQVFTIEGKTFFTFGGGISIDKYMRLEGYTYWKEEIPNYKEIDEGIENLEKYNNMVDYVLTHAIDNKSLLYPLLKNLSSNMYPDEVTNIISYFDDILIYKHWFFGHYHVDGKIGNKKTALYQDVISLENY